MTAAVDVKTIEALRGTELKEKYKEVFGATAKSNNRPYLIKKIVEAMNATAPEQAQGATPDPPAEGTKRAAKPNENASAAPKRRERARDPRLPPVGTVIEREHEGKNIRVKVLEDGFEYRGKTYDSLSAIANEATGTTWNGFLFFRLIPYAKRSRKIA